MVWLAATHVHRQPALIADATALPFRDGAFDLVVAYMCLHDIDAMPQAVAEIARVLGRPGWLCAAIPHPVNSAGSFQGRDPAAPFVISGSYLDPAPDRWVHDRDGVRLTFHSEHRPLEAYMRAVEAAGPADRDDPRGQGARPRRRPRPARPALAADPAVPAPAGDQAGLTTGIRRRPPGRARAAPPGRSRPGE